MPTWAKLDKKNPRVRAKLIKDIKKRRLAGQKWKEIAAYYNHKNETTIIRWAQRHIPELFPSKDDSKIKADEISAIYLELGRIWREVQALKEQIMSANIRHTAKVNTDDVEMNNQEQEIIIPNTRKELNYDPSTFGTKYGKMQKDASTPEEDYNPATFVSELERSLLKVKKKLDEI